ncbi:hypothetical protein I7I50_08997 [Histoplasma capsulatum G186AR]|uniref:Uncharacterized protein n=1 Tax=Ajellomyces capsulatus TaxID=5037 RepID=A0A8H7YPC8_AJECA|nr:hypothetical protein I7I52_06512 [Histoplasma capsulatum]QSS74017.1 hypothetical protein I7I50_08997 [Histoplasma capsulatum G186AR]
MLYMTSGIPKKKKKKSHSSQDSISDRLLRSTVMHTSLGPYDEKFVCFSFSSKDYDMSHILSLLIVPTLIFLHSYLTLSVSLLPYIYSNIASSTVSNFRWCRM